MLLFILNHKYLSLLLKLVNGISWPAKIMGHPFNRYTKLSTGSMKFQHNKLILHVGNTPAFLAAFADTFNSFTTSSTFCFFLDSDDVKINTFVSTSSHFKTILKWYHGNYILKNSNTMSIFYIVGNETHLLFLLILFSPISFQFVTSLRLLLPPSAFSQIFLLTM